MKNGILVWRRWFAVFFLSATMVAIGFTANAPGATKTSAGMRTYTGLMIPVSEPTSIVVVSFTVLSLATFLRRQKNQGDEDNG